MSCDERPSRTIKKTVKMDTHMRTLQKKRTANFREDETKLLIQLWGSPTIQNKLFLTHRKAPVMRLLAANMQQRGFYRTPDEIKTRIRNLKCLYHRIKRTMACGTGIGTVDPDWPHFKAMDDILSKEYPRKETDRIMEEALEGPKMEDIQIKQEIDDIDVDDNDSWATNESVNSEYEDDTPPPPLKPAPTVQQNATAPPLPPLKRTTVVPLTKTTASNLQQQQAGQKLPTILPAFSLPTSTGQHVVGQGQNGKPGGIPFPLLILNNLQPQNVDKGNAVTSTVSANMLNQNRRDDGSTALLKELIEVQKENLELQKQKLDVEKQRLEFDRLIGTQLVTLIPMLGGLLQKLAYPSSQEILDLKIDTTGGSNVSPSSATTTTVSNKRKRPDSSPPTDDVDILKDSKLLRSMLEQGIKKYMMIDEEKDDSDNEEDSGIHNDEHSNSSDK